MLVGMDANQAIGDLTDISPQVKDVVVIEADGRVNGTNLASAAEAERLAEGARRLLEAAEGLRAGVAQLEAATTTGSVFVVRDGERLIAARTSPEPTVGLVFYDLKTCLRSIEPAKPGEEPAASKEPAPKRRAAPKKQREGADAAT
jgi:predicted regulator of Ras-like GTPase activity (Roadblock/LC7/MglB family)